MKDDSTKNKEFNANLEKLDHIITQFGFNGKPIHIDILQKYRFSNINAPIFASGFTDTAGYISEFKKVLAQTKPLLDQTSVDNAKTALDLRVMEFDAAYKGFVSEYACAISGSRTARKNFEKLTADFRTNEKYKSGVKLVNMILAASKYGNGVEIALNHQDKVPQRKVLTGRRGIYEPHEKVYLREMYSRILGKSELSGSKSNTNI